MIRAFFWGGLICTLAYGTPNKLRCPEGLRLFGKKVIVAFSGGPDATSLAAYLLELGAKPVLYYVNYRKAQGGKTSKDLRHAKASAALLGIRELMILRAPLGDRSKQTRNRFFIETLAAGAQLEGTHFIALGTRKDYYEPDESWTDESNRDLDPTVLAQTAKTSGVELITWDTFGVVTKADQFRSLPKKYWPALNATTSCQLFFKAECGRCGSCWERHNAFKEVMGSDKTIYLKNRTIP